MLELLTISNYAIIDELTADFSGGLNVITGETGAGKSIVVDALELVLGARASSEMIRAEASSLDVSGIFSVDRTLLEGVMPMEAVDGPLILRREVRADGNNRCYINDRPVTLRVLKDIGDKLVDFHGQHDHQSLLVVSEHVRFLDGYGGFESLSRDVAHLYNDMFGLRRSIQSVQRDIESARRDRELYSFQLEEIDRANIKPGEDNELEAAIRKLSRARELKTLGTRLFQELSEADESVARRIGGLTAEVEDAARYDSELEQQVEKLAAIEEEIEDIARYFRGYSDGIDDDPALLAELDERMALVERLKKKYGPSLDDVFGHRDRIRSELERAERSDEELEILRSRLAKVESDLAAQSAALSEKRKEAAPHLTKEVEAHLAELGMSAARLVIDIAVCESAEKVKLGDREMAVTENGCDSVEFLITANPGEPPRPLVKVASGGEISRIMLALKLSLMDVNRVPTMVFDEIDVGVSGRIAESVGRKLKKLTEKRQAIVITHLPQIAVMARQHFSARKTVTDDRTRTGLVRLDDDMRRQELASLLSGEKLTDTALAHAQELMDAQKKEDEEDRRKR